MSEAGPGTQRSFYDWAYKVPALLNQPFGVAVDAERICSVSV